MTLHTSTSTENNSVVVEMPLVGLITLWYKASPAQIARFVEGLASLRYAAIKPVFVVQSQGVDEVALLRATVPQAHIIEPGTNLGTAAGWNLAIVYLNTQKVDYIGILNVDVRPDPDYLETLVVTMGQDRTIGATAPLLLFSEEPDVVQAYGATIGLHGGQTVHNYRGQVGWENLPVLLDCEYLDGGTVLLRAEILRQVGGFDPRFFLYDEDCDLSLRVRKVGYRTVAVRDAHCWHYHREEKGPVTPPHELFYRTRNRFYLLRCHGRPRDWWRHLAYSVAGVPRQIGRYLRRRQMRQLHAYLSGLASGLLGRTGKAGWVD